MARVRRDRNIPELCKRTHYRSYGMKFFFWSTVAFLLPYGVYHYGNGRLPPWGFLVIALIGLAGVWRLSANLHAWLNPLDGDLAQSVKACFPDGDAEELFYQIDTDMARHGRRFGLFWIGQTWVLGREAMPIAQIRGVFFFDIHVKGATYHKLALAGAGDIAQETLFYQNADLRAAGAYLLTLVPAAATGDMDDYFAFCGRGEAPQDEREC